jgi:hypothetical protein
MQDRRAREQGRGDAQQPHATALVYPASGKRLDAERDETRYADQKSDIGFLSTQMFNEKGQGGKEKEETEEKTESDETK